MATGLDHLLASVDHDVHDEEAVARIDSLIVDRLVTRLRIEAWYAERETMRRAASKDRWWCSGCRARARPRCTIPVGRSAVPLSAFVGAR